MVATTLLWFLHLFGVVVLLLGKLQTSNVVVFYLHLLFDDLWGPSPIYNAAYFKKFFKMPIRLFDDVVAKVTANDDYFRKKTDAVVKFYSRRWDDE